MPAVLDRKLDTNKQRRWSLSSLLWSFTLPSERSVNAMMKAACEREQKRVHDDAPDQIKESLQSVPDQSRSAAD